LARNLTGLGVIYVLLAFYRQDMVPEPLYRLLVLTFCPYLCA
jgi:hypothetical protein